MTPFPHGVPAAHTVTPRQSESPQCPSVAHPAIFYQSVGALGIKRASPLSSPNQIRRKTSRPAGQEVGRRPLRPVCLLIRTVPRTARTTALHRRRGNLTGSAAALALALTSRKQAGQNLETCRQGSGSSCRGGWGPSQDLSQVETSRPAGVPVSCWGQTRRWPTWPVCGSPSTDSQDLGPRPGLDTGTGGTTG